MLKVKASYLYSGSQSLAQYKALPIQLEANALWYEK